VVGELKLSVGSGEKTEGKVHRAWKDLEKEAVQGKNSGWKPHRVGW